MTSKRFGRVSRSFISLQREKKGSFQGKTQPGHRQGVWEKSKGQGGEKEKEEETALKGGPQGGKNKNRN